MTALCDALYWMVQEGEGNHSGRRGKKACKIQEGIPCKKDGWIYFCSSSGFKKRVRQEFCIKKPEDHEDGECGDEPVKIDFAWIVFVGMQDRIPGKRNKPHVLWQMV